MHTTASELAGQTAAAQPYRPLGKRKTQGPWDVIIIGSGMGGMACGAALAKFGKRVLILEQHYVAGGFTHTFNRKGFSWDVGVHCIGEMGPRDLPGRILGWLTDGSLEWASMGKVYETFHFPDGFSIEFPDNWREFKKILIERFPEERAAIEKYFELVWQVTSSSKPFFALRAMPEWVSRIGSRFIKGREWWAKTTAEVLDTLTTNARLKAVLTAQWGYYGSTPRHSSFAIHALVVRHFWNGGYFPVTGAKSIADRLLKTVEDTGGEALTRASVDEVIVRDGKAVGVRLQGGEELFAPIVISAAGAKATASRLVPREYRESAWAKDLSELGQSPPHICLYLGFEGDVEAAGATKSNQWFMETWDMEEPGWDLTDAKSEAPILYMSFPSLKDPMHDAGPTGRHTGEVVTFVPWQCFEKWQDTRRGRRDPEYLAFKKDIEERLVRQLKRHVPKLMELVKYQELSTPLSTTFFTRAPEGAIYGLEATPRRFLSPRLRTRTPIKNLYLAGGDVATLGVTGALMGGILAAGTVQPRVLAKLSKKLEA